MIGLSDEYEKMYRVEGKLWWYRILHERVETALQQHFGQRRNIQILDLGCGTGGLLDFLRRHGYANLRGIDGSGDAVNFCRERDLTVTWMDLKELKNLEPLEYYDAIVCNDVFSYFTDTDLLPLMEEIARRLKPTGILISNNNAFDVFRGQHDLAVGTIRRFVRTDFDQLLTPRGFRIQTATYWSLALSPLILLMRQWQNWQLRSGLRNKGNAESDVYLPPSWLNETLYRIVHIEQKWFPRTPFGSSLFLIGVINGKS